MKIIKRITILLLLLAFVVSFNSCYAIDLNLTDPIDNVSSSDSSNSTSGNTSSGTSSSGNSNTSSTTSSSQNNVTNTTDNSYNDNNYSNTTSNTYGNTNSTSPATSTTVSAVSADDGLSAGDIINIFVIVIGLILMFLGIAILIQLKK